MSAQPVITIATDAAAATREVARRLATRLRPGDLLVLDGPLGAGKTTFTQGLGEGLGVRGPVASPTFVISRVHPSLHGGPELVHVDAYRLGGAFDVDDLDLDSDLEEAVTVVEWGREIVERISDSHVLIELDREQGGTGEPSEPSTPTDEAPDTFEEPRTISLRFTGPRWDAARVAGVAEALAGAGGETTDARAGTGSEASADTSMGRGSA